MEVEYLSKAEWSETIEILFQALDKINTSLENLNGYFYIFLVLGGVLLISILMYKVIKIFL